MPRLIQQRGQKLQMVDESRAVTRFDYQRCVDTKSQCRLNALFFSDDGSNIFQDEVPAEMVTIDRDLGLATLRPPAVKQRLLLVQPLVKVRDLPHLRQGSQFYLVYTFSFSLTNFVDDFDSFCLTETGVILVSA